MSVLGTLIGVAFLMSLIIFLGWSLLIGQVAGEAIGRAIAARFRRNRG